MAKKNCPSRRKSRSNTKESLSLKASNPNGWSNALSGKWLMGFAGVLCAVEYCLNKIIAIEALLANLISIFLFCLHFLKQEDFKICSSLRKTSANLDNG